MTKEQHKLFGEILDLNWEIKEDYENRNIADAWNKKIKLEDLKDQLRDDMGADEYDAFMNNGRKMFAPKED